MSVEHGLYVEPDRVNHFSTGHHVQRVTVDETFIMVEDPMLGNFVVDGRNGHQVYYDYLTTPNLYRSAGISQLSKDEASATIPNTASFTRQWHILGLFDLVNRFCDRQNDSEEVRLAYHLAADADDQAHLLESHSSEQAIQKWGGPEDYHEIVWPEIAELGGTSEVLRKHGVTVNSNILIPGIEIPGWIIDKHPDINVDNFQYAVTELLLWFDHDGSPPEITELVRLICSPENLEITDTGQLAFRDLEIARIFAKGYLLLSTEHWNEPLNRVQLHLLIQATQRAIVKRRIAWMDKIDKGEQRLPEHYLFGIDQDVIDAMNTGPKNPDDFMFAITNTVRSIATQERKRFIDYKLGEYATFLLDAKAQDYPSDYLPLTRVQFGPKPSQVAISVIQKGGQDDQDIVARKIPVLEDDPNHITYRLPPFKNRFVDPLVRHASGFVRLSEVDQNYKNLLGEQQQLQHTEVVVQLAFAAEFEESFRQGVKLNDDEFETIKKRSPMTNDQRRRVIELAGARAQSLSQARGTLILKAVA